MGNPVRRLGGQRSAAYYPVTEKRSRHRTVPTSIAVSRAVLSMGQSYFEAKSSCRVPILVVMNRLTSLILAGAMAY